MSRLTGASRGLLNCRKSAGILFLQQRRTCSKKKYHREKQTSLYLTTASVLYHDYLFQQRIDSTTHLTVGKQKKKM